MWVGKTRENALSQIPQPNLMVFQSIQAEEIIE
jgi:hypothetical protein